MKVIPAIDLKDKKCVRLAQGDFARADVYSDNPKSVAESFMKDGASLIHVVDLDGAKVGRLVNFDIIDQMSFVAPLQVGGGIRRVAELNKVVGVEARAVVSTAVVKDEKFRKAVARLKGKVSLAIDAKGGEIVTDGWLNKTGLDAFEFAKENEDICSAIVFTSVLKDGMMQGPDFEATARMKKEISVPLIAAGGISSYEDLEELKRIGVYGCIIGKALYSGKIELAKAIKKAK